LADKFNSFWCTKHDLKPKPIRFDFRDGTTRLLGQHAEDRIRLHRKLDDSERWSVLLHEIAHYRVHHHRRAFVLELAEVYKAWKEFLQTNRLSKEEAKGNGKHSDEQLAIARSQ